MNRTYNPINQFSLSSQRPSLRERLTTFIEKHTGVFEALTRHGFPHGGSWLPAPAAATLPATELTAETMMEVERELDAIILRLSQLNNSLNTGSSAPRSQAGGRSSKIGIERFRALQLGA